jgi:putative ABC transport system permease protein
MEQLFADRLQAEPSLRLWLETIADIGVSSLREHWHTLLLDGNYTLRGFAAEPGFTALAVLVMAIGISACVSIFSVSDAVLFRSFPYREPEQLVFLWSPNHNFKGVPDQIGPNLPDLLEWQKRSHSFSEIAGFSRRAVNLVQSGSSTRIGAAAVTGGFFNALGVSAMMGRALGPQDERSEFSRIVVISSALWRSRFGSTISIVGKEIQLNRQKYTIVGVMPPEFGFPFDADVPYERSDFRQTELWFPAAFTQQQQTDRTNGGVGVDAIARLRPGVSLMRSEAELAAIQSALQPLYPPIWRGFSVLLSPFVRTILGPVQEMFWILLAAVGLVLFMAVGNTANLLLTRTTARAHELGIRSALGAERRRIIRQLLTESLLLSIGAGAVAVVFSFALVRVLVALDPGGIPRFEQASVDGRVLTFAIVLSAVAGALAGIVPALLASRANVNLLLKSGGRSALGSFVKTRSILIVIQVALSIILLATSGLLIRSYLNLMGVDPGFSPATLTFKIDLDERYRTPEQSARFYHDILKKFQAAPGVLHAGESNGLPLTSWESVNQLEIEGAAPVKQMVQGRSITPDYRQALGVPLLRGRDFTEQDVASQRRVALINQSFASTYLGGRDPIGTCIRLGIGNFSDAPWITVVGVVAKTAHDSLEDRDQPMTFVPALEGSSFAIACRVPPEQITAHLRAILHSMDPVLTIADVRTMGERMKASNARRTLETSLLTGFSVLAVCLAVAGVYGLMSYLVRQRTREIGLRVALGSSKGRIMSLIVIQAMKLVLLGVASGICAALVITRLLTTWLFHVSAADTVTFVLAPLAVLIVTCLGCILPASEATRVDPIEALRSE